MTIFTVGECVQYFSRSQQKWLPATITVADAVADARGVQVDLKPGMVIPPAKYGVGLRKLAGAGISFAVGEKVKYFSSSQQRWYDTEVVAANDFAGVQVSLRSGLKK